jgi:transporter family-2 protein
VTDTVRYFLIMIAAGVGVPILAAMNTTLGVRLGNPAAAAMCLFAIALICATAVFLIGGAHGFEKF